VQRAAEQDVRLTRRGRLARAAALVVLLAVLAVSLVDTFVASRALADTAAPAPVGTRAMTVTPGDSLWSIARAAHPEADPREVVLAIRDLNAMRSNLIHPGQELLIPEVG
jgi:LysM repeat protein